MRIYRATNVVAILTVLGSGLWGFQKRTGPSAETIRQVGTAQDPASQKAEVLRIHREQIRLTVPAFDQAIEARKASAANAATTESGIKPPAADLALLKTEFYKATDRLAAAILLAVWNHIYGPGLPLETSGSKSAGFNTRPPKLTSAKVYLEEAKRIEWQYRAAVFQLLRDRGGFENSQVLALEKAGMNAAIEYAIQDLAREKGDAAGVTNSIEEVRRALLEPQINLSHGAAAFTEKGK